LHFNTHTAAGTPITLAGTPAVSVYKGSTTESTTGVSLTVDYDSRTGMHYVAIDTSADGTFYAAGSDFSVVITTGTVNSISVVGTVVGRFSLNARAALRPTTAGRTLDVSATGEAGIDWANVGSPTTTLALTGTTVSSSQVAASVTGAVGSVTGNVGGNVVGSVASVTAGVTVTTNNDKTGYALTVTPPTAAAIATAVHTTQMTESYNADGTAPTLAEALFVSMQRLTEFRISGTTITVKKLDGSASAYTLDLDSSTAPTRSTRVT
jgi:hypothetical protein